MSLVLHLDENNGNSWGGEPTTNVSIEGSDVNTGKD